LFEFSAANKRKFYFVTLQSNPLNFYEICGDNRTFKSTGQAEYNKVE